MREDNMSLNDKLWDWLGKTPRGDFTADLSLCFELLVPITIKAIIAEQECDVELAYAILFKKWLNKLEEDIANHNAPLALCKAIEKLEEK